jgi:hypothetical protein
LDAEVDCSDRIIETVTPAALDTIGQPADNNEFLRRIDELFRRTAVLSAESYRPLSKDRRSSPRDRPYNSSPPRYVASTTCW